MGFAHFKNNEATIAATTAASELNDEVTASDVRRH